MKVILRLTVENLTVKMKILYQDEGLRVMQARNFKIRGGKYRALGLTIKSYLVPMILPEVIYLRGKDTLRDYHITEWNFETENNVKEWMDAFNQVRQQLNPKAKPLHSSKKKFSRLVTLDL